MHLPLELWGLVFEFESSCPLRLLSIDRRLSTLRPQLKEIDLNRVPHLTDTQLDLVHSCRATDLTPELLRRVKCPPNLHHLDLHLMQMIESFILDRYRCLPDITVSVHSLDVMLLRRVNECLPHAQLSFKCLLTTLPSLRVVERNLVSLSLEVSGVPGPLHVELSHLTALRRLVMNCQLLPTDNTISVGLHEQCTLDLFNCSGAYLQRSRLRVRRARVATWSVSSLCPETLEQLTVVGRGEFSVDPVFRRLNSLQFEGFHLGRVPVAVHELTLVASSASVTAPLTIARINMSRIDLSHPRSLRVLQVHCDNVELADLVNQCCELRELVIDSSFRAIPIDPPRLDLVVVPARSMTELAAVTTWISSFSKVSLRLVTLCPSSFFGRHLGSLDWLSMPRSAPNSHYVWERHITDQR